MSPLAMELASSTNSAQFVVVQALAARIVAAAHSTVTDHHGTTMQPTRYTNSTEVPIVDWVSPIVPGML